MYSIVKNLNKISSDGVGFKIWLSKKNVWTAQWQLFNLRAVFSYTSDELRYFPVNTVLYDPPKKMKNMLAKPAGSSESSSDDSSEVGELVYLYLCMI